MKFASLTSPLRSTSQALSPNNVANKLVETGYRVGGQAGATIAGGVGVLGGGAAAYAVFEKMNPLETVSQVSKDVGSAGSIGAKLGAVLGGTAEVLVELATPAMMLTFAFESLDSMAQAWDKPANKIKLDD
ncbi:hypothetical protein L6R52_38075 [Myxococcota bacterium]|nr:hypothetical protein [Myxococcota bacterium]